MLTSLLLKFFFFLDIRPFGLGVSTGQLGSSLCLTWTQPDRLGWEKLEPATHPCGASDRVLSISGAYRAVSGSVQGV